MGCNLTGHENVSGSRALLSPFSAAPKEKESIAPGAIPFRSVLSPCTPGGRRGHVAFKKGPENYRAIGESAFWAEETLPPRRGRRVNQDPISVFLSARCARVYVGAFFLPPWRKSYPRGCSSVDYWWSRVQLFAERLPV